MNAIIEALISRERQTTNNDSGFVKGNTANNRLLTFNRCEVSWESSFPFQIRVAVELIDGLVDAIEDFLRGAGTSGTLSREVSWESSVPFQIRVAVELIDGLVDTVEDFLRRAGALSIRAVDS
jgi:hypothetical protein